MNTLICHLDQLPVEVIFVTSDWRGPHDLSASTSGSLSSGVCFEFAWGSCVVAASMWPALQGYHWTKGLLTCLRAEGLGIGVPRT